MSYAFDWDPDKATKNLRKHRINFADAIHVFDDPMALHVQDRVEDQELRWQVIGRVAGIKILLVAYVSRGFQENTEFIRIISARRAEKHEQIFYAQQYGPDDFERR
jgi:uncharacterized protein